MSEFPSSPSRLNVAGFSLLEVLIAVVVFSIGILGAGAMVLSSVRNTNNSYLRSQASFIAEGMAERMRANPLGVVNGKYNGALRANAPSLPTCPCNESQMADRDRRMIGEQLAAQLPAGTGSVTCTLASSSAFGSGRGFPPVPGQCRIRVTWNEARDLDAEGNAGAQQFDLVIQP